jgi:hypothetical protein
MIETNRYTSFQTLSGRSQTTLKILPESGRCSYKKNRRRSADALISSVSITLQH